jgi:penicillin-binding protein 1A
MSDDEPTITPQFQPPQLAADPQPAKPKLKKRRTVLLLIPLALLAGISTVFGMMMALAGDLPNLESAKEFQTARNSTLVDRLGKPLGILTSDRNRVLVSYEDISPFMRNAIIAVEDERYYENEGVDVRGIARAFYQDVIRGGARQGGSTITQQFVKNALEAQSERTLFQKLREAALAYHLTRKWSKSKILREYLNSIYFGNGAYGIESAARVYFGSDPGHADCGTRAAPCARDLTAAEAALLAGVVANPSAYDPVAHPQAALDRRNLVLAKMLEQGKITREEYEDASQQALPGRIVPPTVTTKAPYFTTWVSQQLVEKFGARQAFEGGLRVKTTLDLDLQQAASAAVQRNLSVAGPAAAMVVIDNGTGEVRALVGGGDYAQRPFNLATQGQRQPGSTVKPFILAAAMRRGIGIGSVWESRKREFDVPNGGSEKFVVNNFEDSYAGVRTLGSALTVSDNAVYAAAGLKTGTKRISRLIERMGVRSPVSTNPAMTLGAFKQGVSVLDWAHAYESFATGGKRTSGSLGAPNDGPVGIKEVRRIEDRKLLAKNERRSRRVLPAEVAATTTAQMQTVVASGTGRRAAYGGFAAGKTGTTENFGDAWFVGFTKQFTIAVWVGYPDETRPMKTEFGGEPVAGGTFPALIWRDFVLQAKTILERRAADRAARRAEKLGTSGPTGATGLTGTPAPEVSDPTGGDAPDEPAGDGERDAGKQRKPDKPAAEPETPATPEPAPETEAAPSPEPEPAPEPAPDDGSGGGVSAPG